MPRARKSPEDKLEDQIKIIADRSDKHLLDNLGSNDLKLKPQDTEYPPHTMLKLAYLNYYLGVFLPIAGYWKKQGKFDKIVFIDAFAGSGLVRILRTKYSVLGSTLLAATATARGTAFDEIIAVEIDSDRCNLLRSRCSQLGLSNVSVINGDVNNVISSLPRLFNITNKTIVMLFIDPEGMEPEFSKFLVLSSATDYLDIMLNYTFGIRRLNGRIEYNHNSADIKKMQAMIPNWVPGNYPDERLADFFENNFGKPKGRSVGIHSTGGKEEYSIVLRVRQTWGDSQWLNAMDEFGEYISRTDGDHALTALQIVTGDQLKL